MNRRIVRIPPNHPSFMEGIARVMDVGGTLNRYDSDGLMAILRELQAHRLAMPPGLEAETKAIQEVWTTVGQCIRDPLSHLVATEQDALQVWTDGNERVGRKD